MRVSLHRGVTKCKRSTVVAEEICAGGHGREGVGWGVGSGDEESREIIFVIKEFSPSTSATNRLTFTESFITWVH